MKTSRSQKRLSDKEAVAGFQIITKLAVLQPDPRRGLAVLVREEAAVITVRISRVPSLKVGASLPKLRFSSSPVA